MSTSVVWLVMYMGMEVVGVIKLLVVCCGKHQNLVPSDEVTRLHEAIDVHVLPGSVLDN